MKLSRHVSTDVKTKEDLIGSKLVFELGLYMTEMCNVVSFTTTNTEKGLCGPVGAGFR